VEKPLDAANGRYGITNGKRLFCGGVLRLCRGGRGWLAFSVSFLQQNRVRRRHIAGFFFAFLQQNPYDCARMGTSCLFVGRGTVNLGRAAVHQFLTKLASFVIGRSI